MRRPRGFTLVELLVVIAIISILMAILLPVLKGARHRALVLVCPIVYTGVDDRIHLTDPQGAHNVAFAVRGYANSWSPSGLRIGITEQKTERSSFYSAILDPMSGNVVPYAPVESRGGAFMLWLDERRFYEFGGKPGGLTVLLREVDTGAVCAEYDYTGLVLAYPWSPGPLPLQCAPMAMVAMAVGPESMDIVLLRKDLSIGRRMGFSSRLDFRQPESPRVDPMGEWVAWTQAGLRARRCIALKNLSDAPTAPPIYCDTPYSAVRVCDWSEDGNLILANVTENGSDWNLALFDKRGKLVRTIPTAVPPKPDSLASWRKYGHR